MHVGASTGERIDAPHVANEVKRAVCQAHRHRHRAVMGDRLGAEHLGNRELGLRVQGLRSSRVQGPGFGSLGVWGLESEVWGLEVRGLGFRVQGLGFRV